MNHTHKTDSFPIEYQVRSGRELAHFLRFEIHGAEWALSRYLNEPMEDGPEYWAGYLAGATNALNALEGMTE